MRAQIRRWLEENGGVVGTIPVAAFFRVSPARVRAWAGDNGVPVVGSNAYAFTLEHAEQFAAEVFEDYDDEDDDEDDDDDDDGQDEDEE